MGLPTIDEVNLPGAPKNVKNEVVNVMKQMQCNQTWIRMSAC